MCNGNNNTSTNNNNSNNDISNDSIMESNSKTSPSLRNIWILCSGSRGDVQPFVAVASAFVKKGYRVCFFTQREFVDLASSFLTVGSDTDAEVVVLRESNEDLGIVMDPNAPLKSLLLTNERSASMSAQVIRSHLLQHERPDLVLTSFMTMGLAWYLQIHHNVPFLDLSPVLLAHGPSRLINWIVHYWFVPQLYQMARYHFRELDPQMECRNNNNNNLVVSCRRFQQFLQQPDRPYLVMMSPILAQVQHPKAPDMYKFIGTTVLEADQQTNSQAAQNFGGNDHVLQQMRDFIIMGGQDDENKTKKPLYLGWGSMTTRSPENLCLLCVRALYHSQQRAIVLSGEANLSFDMLQKVVAAAAAAAKGHEPLDYLLAYAQENILFVPTAPHEWLFPQVAATVHHGGAGTTTAALRSGVPTILTPFFADQPENAALVSRLGVGIGFTQSRQQLDSLRWQDLSAAITRVLTDQTMQARAKELRQALLAEPNGADVAVAQAEQFWHEYCVTNKFQNLSFPGQATAMAKANDKKGCSFLGMVGVALVSAMVSLLAIVVAKRG